MESRTMRIDRTMPKPAKDITVSDELEREYKKCTTLPESKYYLENEVYRSALDKLDDGDAQVIRKIQQEFHNGYKGADKKAIKNFGDQSVLELLAKLGIWMNAVERERER